MGSCDQIQKFNMLLKLCIGLLNRWNFCKPFISVEMASWVNERFYLSGLQIYRISHFVASLLMTQIFIKIFWDTEKVILMKWAFFFTLLFVAVTSFIMCKNKIRTLHTSVILFKLSHEINLCQLCLKNFDKSAFIKYCYIVEKRSHSVAAACKLDFLLL